MKYKNVTPNILIFTYKQKTQKWLMGLENVDLNSIIGI